MVGVRAALEQYFEESSMQLPGVDALTPCLKTALERKAPTTKVLARARVSRARASLARARMIFKSHRESGHPEIDFTLPTGVIVRPLSPLPAITPVPSIPRELHVGHAHDPGLGPGAG